MQFRVLGPVELAGEGPRVALGSERRRLILAVLLAARGKVVSVDRLADAIWGESPPDTATKTLRSHVSRLRAELSEVGAGGDQRLVTSTDGYRLAVTADELDAARFEELVRPARTLVDTDPGKAAAVLEEAQQLWRGPAFGELAAHEDVRDEAVRLERLRQEAAADLIDAQLALGRHRQVVGELEARVAAAPLEERAQGQLMVALYRSGRQADALSTYRAVQQRLREELGVDPSPSLRTLHEQMLRQAPELTAPQPPPAGRTEHVDAHSDPRGGPAGSPMAVTRLIGRDDDARSVSTLVTAATVVTLTGPGGVGKTRLAEQVGASVAERFDDGVVTVSLASVRDPDSVGAALVAALELPQPGGRPVEETLVAGLGTRRLLLVLDNCEHVLASVSQLVDAVLGRCPNVAVLATSREPLRLSGERVWQVAPLPVPPRDATGAEVADSAAGALFCARAAAAEPGFSLTDADATTVAELCRRLDGMPLAIELAAARVRAMTTGDLLERLSDRFSVLTGGPHHEGGRHQTLQAVVAWSYDLLSESEARLFDRLSVFAGRFSLEAAEQVGAGDGLSTGAVAGVLAELTDKSMVTIERGDAVRYRLLDTLRDFAATRLVERGETDVSRRAHADYHVALVEQLGPQVRGPNEAVAVPEIDAAVDDLRVAHAWLLTLGDIDGALRLPTALCDYVILRLRDEMLTWTEQAVQLPGSAGHPLYPTALATAAMGATHRGELDRARGHADAALSRAPTGSVAVVWALDALQVAALFEGRLDDVLAFDDRMTAAADAMAEDYYRAFVGLHRVLALLYRGDAETARTHAARLEEAAESSGNPTMRAWARYCHGEALMDTAPAEAARRLEEAIAIASSVGSLPEGVALVSLASLCGRRGETDRALALFRDVIARWRRLGNYSHQLTTLRNLVEILARLDAGETVDETAARLYGAVSAGSTPSFGAEAERLATAWAQLERRMGAATAQATAARGQRLSVAEMADEALTTLDALLDT